MSQCFCTIAQQVVNLNDSSGYKSSGASGAQHGASPSGWINTNAMPPKLSPVSHKCCNRGRLQC